MSRTVGFAQHMHICLAREVMKNKLTSASATPLNVTRFPRFPVRGRASSTFQSFSVTARPLFTRCSTLCHFHRHNHRGFYAVLQSANASPQPSTSHVAVFLYHVSPPVGQAIDPVFAASVVLADLCEPCLRVLVFICVAW